MKVFVYGSLREGGPLHHYYFNKNLFCGKARTAPGYVLFDITNGAFPAMAKSADQSQVYGEVYEVDDSLLAQLDRAEGHPHFYCRTEILLENSETVFAYLLPLEDIIGYPKVGDGDWLPFIVKANQKSKNEIDKWFI